MTRLEAGGPEHRTVEFVEALGKGGFGAVFLADVRSRDNFVQRLAIKVLNKELEDNTDVVARQRDEGRLLAQLNHDHIVKVFDLVELSGRPAVFMEYVPGVDAGRILREEAISPRAVLEIAAAAASALHAAWWTVSPVTGRALQVIHRDIKPSNLLVSEFGTVKVLDFGIARADFDREGQTRSVQFGTARYMAPEQWLANEVSRAVDVFGLGISIIEMLQGRWSERLPLRESEYTAARDALVAGCRDPRWGMVWWRRLDETLCRMLAFDPEERPAADEVQEICLDLSEMAVGESLRRVARDRVPQLMKKHRNKMASIPLLPDAELVMHTESDPSILTASKTTFPGSSTDFELEPDRWVQAIMVLGIVLAFVWFVTG